MKENNSLISIVLPVYNVEQYLHKCFDSLISQTYENIEIVAINDGSTDNSGKICDLYSEKDPRIKVIHQDNEGLSHARNIGIANSVGEYLTFVDSDDFIDRNYIEILHSSLIQNEADIAIGQFTFFDESSEKEIVGSNSENISTKIKIFNSNEVISKIYSDEITTFVTAWGKLFPKKFFEDIEFPKGKVYEDEYTTYKIYLKSHKVVFVDQIIYYYRERINSISRSIFDLKVLDAVEARTKRLYDLENNGINVTKYRKQYLKWLISILYKLKKNGFITEYKKMKSIFNKEYTLYLTSEVTLIERVEIILWRYGGLLYNNLKNRL